MKNNGFTLIELMIVISIISIVTVLSYVSYIDYTTQSKRAEAVALLLTTLQKEERYLTEYGTYVQDLTLLGFTSKTPKSDSGNYRLRSVNCAPAPCIKLIAQPLGLQATRDNNNILTIDTLGRRSGNWND